MKIDDFDARLVEEEIQDELRQEYVVNRDGSIWALGDILNERQQEYALGEAVDSADAR